MKYSRLSPSKRGYGRKWQKASKEYLKENPLCKMHLQLGQIEGAQVVDHKIPHKGNMHLFWDMDNWQGLCKECHDSHKQAQERSGNLRGVGADGIPLDDMHHWNRAKS